MTDNKFTKGHLAPATIYAVTENSKERDNLRVNCMFNPYEYTITKANQYDDSKIAQGKDKLEFKKSGPQTLKLKLIFNTHGAEVKENQNDILALTNDNKSRDVTLITEKLWGLMEPTEASSGKKKKGAPFVVFKWGVFHFTAVITNMTQKFTLFDKDGTPLRASVDITFTQYSNEDDYMRAPTENKSAEKLINIVSGDRLDSIAARIYGDAGKWRDIATHNNITNPLNLQPGQSLLIPEI